MKTHPCVCLCVCVYGLTPIFFISIDRWIRMKGTIRRIEFDEEEKNVFVFIHKNARRRTQLRVFLCQRMR